MSVYNGHANHYVVGVVNDDSGRAQHVVVMDRSNGLLYALQYAGTGIRIPEVPSKGTQGWQGLPIVGYWEFQADRKSLKSLPTRIQQLFIQMFGHVMADAQAYKTEYTRVLEQRKETLRENEQLHYDLRVARAELAKLKPSVEAPKAPAPDKVAKKTGTKSAKQVIENYYGIQNMRVGEPVWTWPVEE